MTISHSLAPIPKWIVLNNDGTPSGGAKMYTYRSKNKDEYKSVYRDPAGAKAWPNPVPFDLNGTEGPFYWTVDSDDLGDTYYLRFYDSNDVFLYDIQNYFPPGGGGGGGSSTTYAPILNYITNNQFINHMDDMVAPANLTNTVVAPSNHKGFTPANSSALIGTYGALGPDIRFLKSDTGLATDQITFPLFALGSYPLTGDVTPVDYVRYVCNGTQSGENYKCFQFPITQKVKNLSAQSMTFGIWARVTTLPIAINIFLRQYYGSGTAATAESGLTRGLIGTANLTTSWQWFPFTFASPSTAGGSLGTPGEQTDDDALYVQVEMPLGVPSDVLFTKPGLFLGNIDPELEFSSYDQIDSINQTPRTGDIRSGYYSVTPRGWLPMNDGTIGNTGSGATTRANQDTFQLYSTLYTAISDTWAPVSTGRTAPGNTMAAAITDFIAGKTLRLPYALGRALSQLGIASNITPATTDWVLGQYFGEQNHLMLKAELVSHKHVSQPGTSAFVTVGNGVITDSTGGANGTFPTTGDIEGGTNPNTPFNVVQPTTFVNYIIKL